MSYNLIPETKQQWRSSKDNKKAQEFNQKLRSQTKKNPLTTTVRGAISSSTTVNVNGTYGISKGAYIEGFGVNNSSNNPLTAVSISETAGSITTTIAQTLTANTTLNILGSSNSYKITGDITIDKMPTTNKTIYLDLDKILTRGTAS